MKLNTRASLNNITILTSMAQLEMLITKMKNTKSRYYMQRPFDYILCGGDQTIELVRSAKKGTVATYFSREKKLRDGDHPPLH